MSFDEDLDGLNNACLDVFAEREPFLFTPADSGEPQQIRGILDTGVEPEDAPPGDGSTYATLWFKNQGVAPAPVVGDEIASGTTVYKVVRLRKDAGRGLGILLRQNRMVI